jgi:hypothetical protein
LVEMKLTAAKGRRLQSMISSWTRNPAARTTVFVVYSGFKNITM